MVTKRIEGALVFGTTLILVPAFSQEGHTESKSDAAVQALGSFVTSTTDHGVKPSATSNGGVLASHRFYSAARFWRIAKTQTAA